MTSFESDDNCYEVLKVAPDAPIEVIRAAWRALCALHHPDRRPGDVHAQLHMTRINRAYEVLSDAEQRARHDREWCGRLPPASRRPGAALRAAATVHDAPPTVLAGWQPRGHRKDRRHALTALAAVILAGVLVVLILAWTPHEPEHISWQQAPSATPLDMVEPPSYGPSDGRLRLAFELAHQPVAEPPVSAKPPAR